MKRFVLLLLLLIPVIGISQSKIRGTILELDAKKNEILLSGVRVYWLGSSIETTTDENGRFSIPYEKGFQKIVVESPNHESITVLANRPNLGKIRLHKQVNLEEVIVEKEVEPLQKSLFNVQNVVTVSSREMLKAACCNLSESFETNPSIDVNISDAVTGAKQIQMLGLTSPYLLFTQENMPLIKGASQIYGLSFIPGSWVESIQITKGSGNVVNGFESISGQINTELVKPLTDKKLFVNLYGNNYERFEFNTRYNETFSEKLGMGIYIHSNLRTGKIDNNSDTFLDTPLSKQINVMNRWQYLDSKNGWVGFLNLQYLDDQKQTGQVSFDPNTDKFTNNFWGSEVETQRLDVSGKLGYVFPKLKYQSLGLQLAYSQHNQDSYYGFNQYDILHDSFYSNLIFNSIIGSTRHKFKVGLNFNYDSFNENVNEEKYIRADKSIGSFFEYTYDSLEKLSFVLGLRVDNHNRLSTFITPRFHLRYSLWEKASIRSSIGKGRRLSNIFAENQQLFASARQINVIENDGPIYSLNSEKAWNYGVGFIQKFYLGNRPFEFSFDFYRTVFQDQVVVDWENPTEISFYNLTGESSSNSYQIDLNYELLQSLKVRMTYKNYNVPIDYASGRFQRPFQSSDRFFTNLNYETSSGHHGSQWRFDFTYNWQGKQRIPTMANETLSTFKDGFSKGYSILNFQITKVFSHGFEAYLGGENIANFTQANPIIGSDDPFGLLFDTTQVYGPILGATYYAGVRFKILTNI
ncbi:TonB-dependent receptor plug domain-containing protein [Allomuricauda sp. R78024]|uniref:TonB-dependent receptor n=1 Tax=Allomuricauda sp. R78024 TaxID=3093867 RepID=UPI0037C71A5E